MQDAEANDTVGGGDSDGMNSHSPGLSASGHSAPASPARSAHSVSHGANHADRNSPSRSPHHSPHYSLHRSPNRSPVPRGLPTGMTASSLGLAPGSPNTNTSSGTSSGTTQSSTDMSSLSAAVSRLRSTPGGSSENSTVATSAFSFSIADPAPQRSHYAYSFHQDGTYDGAEDDHMHDNMHDNMHDDDYTESDEEEQIRLAMELSLAFTSVGEKQSCTDSVSADMIGDTVSPAQPKGHDGDVVMCEKAYDSSSALDTQPAAAAAHSILSFEDVTVSLSNTTSNGTPQLGNECAEEPVGKVSADGI